MKKVILALTLVFTLALTGCGNSNGVAKAPSGQDCGENVAYLQAGVDKFTEVIGTIPTDVNQLLESKDGKGPFVEKIPACPSGNIYVIDNGVIKEASR